MQMMHMGLQGRMSSGPENWGTRGRCLESQPCNYVIGVTPDARFRP